MLFTLLIGLLVLNTLWFSKMMVGVAKFLQSEKERTEGDLKETKSSFGAP